ncbi:hypothetical protein IQ241_16680 [Romeria aff. gracilis LEGE 07310]|uniref:DUF2281 domain-containing protein n=1 Tax=Vasconcelosia minhoensis LEGE 07310 TaxID=915328 RepID=A0A8J7DDL3_9CYAN|nr:hypothetical protein [Romeria gracilis]MBE9078908.1 hypothetical protein [Romeria aff. gracilis LEGE 07310]
MTTKELILQELEQVPEATLRTVLDFLRSLKQGRTESRAESPFAQFSGILSDEEAEDIQAMVAEEFEQVDLNAW